MRNQYIVSFYKMRRFLFLYICLLFLAAADGAWGYIKLSAVEHMSLYEVFKDAGSDTSFTFIITLLSSLFIGRDFNNRTIQHEIKLGYSRVSVIVVRAVPVFLMAVVLHFTGMLSAMIGFGIKNGFSMSSFSGRDVWWCVTIAMQLAAFQSMIVFLIFLIRTLGTAMITSVCFTFAACNMLRNYTDAKIFRISCFCLVRDNLTETLLPAAVFALAVVMIMFLASCFVFEKAEIK